MLASVECRIGGEGRAYEAEVDGQPPLYRAFSQSFVAFEQSDGWRQTGLRQVSMTGMTGSGAEGPSGGFTLWTIYVSYPTTGTQ